MKKKVIKTMGWIVLVYVALVIGLYLGQRSMIYIYNAQKPDIKNSSVADIKEITVKTEDGLTLSAWYKPARPNMPTMIRFHGNASNVLWNMEAMAPYIEQGYGALSAEYRGYAGNPGKPTEDGLYKDAHAYMQFLQAEGVLTNNIIVYGESLGTGPAVQAAIDYPGIHTLILQTPFTALADAASKHYPFLPVKWLLLDRYDSLFKIKNIKTSLIIVHGTDDGVVPYKLGKKLFEAADEPKSLITVEGGRHNDLEDFKISEKILSALSE